MSATNPRPPCHSAIVRMDLHLNGHVFSIGQMGMDFLVLDHPIDHPPADAEISMSIDGREDRWRVHLAEGIQTGKRKTAISALRGQRGS